MHEPMSATSIFCGKPFSFALAATVEIGIAASGEKGPLMCGSSVERSISITRSKYFAGLAKTSGSACRSAATVLARLETAWRPVALR